MELTVLRFGGRHIKLRGEAYVDGTLIAEAEISSSLIDRDLMDKSKQEDHAAFKPAKAPTEE
jgi:hypothetical protein